MSAIDYSAGNEIEILNKIYKEIKFSREINEKILEAKLKFQKNVNIFIIVMVVIGVFKALIIR